MVATRDDVLRQLDEYSRGSKASGPVTLSDRYLRAVEQWETFPENAEGAEKGWVLRADRSWRRTIDRAKLVR